MPRSSSEKEFVQRSMSLPESVDKLWTATAAKTGLNKTSVFIVALRAYAKAEGVSDPDGEEASDGRA